MLNNRILYDERLYDVNIAGVFGDNKSQYWA